jgi:hypothetical protein
MNPMNLFYYSTKKTTRVKDAAKVAKVFEFKQYQPGDEIWQYNDIRLLSGTAGFLLIREGKAIEYKVTCIS